VRGPCSRRLHARSHHHTLPRLRLLMHWAGGESKITFIIYVYVYVYVHVRSLALYIISLFFLLYYYGYAININ